MREFNWRRKITKKALLNLRCTKDSNACKCQCVPLPTGVVRCVGTSCLPAHLKPDGTGGAICLTVRDLADF